MLQDLHHHTNAKEVTLNDYHPVLLIPIVMKCFETLVMQHIKYSLPTKLDSLQFAYSYKRSTDNAVSLALHLALRNLDTKGSYTR